VKDFDAIRQEQCDGLSSTYRDEQGAGRSVFGSSLMPMLVIGLVLTFAGMIAAVVLS
jgi:hypothetical protein